MEPRAIHDLLVDLQHADTLGWSPGIQGLFPVRELIPQ